MRYPVLTWRIVPLEGGEMWAEEQDTASGYSPMPLLRDVRHVLDEEEEGGEPELVSSYAVATRCPRFRLHAGLSTYAFAARCPVLTLAMPLPEYGICQVLVPIARRAWYKMPGTDVVYLVPEWAMCCVVEVSMDTTSPGISLRVWDTIFNGCGMGFAVLTQRMMLPGLLLPVAVIDSPTHPTVLLDRNRTMIPFGPTWHTVRVRLLHADAMGGRIPYAPTLVLRDVRWHHPIVLHLRYAMSGTDVGYVATRSEEVGRRRTPYRG
eukprot:1005955-Rhodomonas_salina.1